MPKQDNYLLSSLGILPLIKLLSLYEDTRRSWNVLSSAKTKTKLLLDKLVSALAPSFRSCFFLLLLLLQLFSAYFFYPTVEFDIRSYSHGVAPTPSMGVMLLGRLILLYSCRE